MGLIKAFSGALGGTLADQWKDIITAGEFDEHDAVVPGLFITSNNGRSSNSKGSVAVVTNGSKIYIPENVAAMIFDQSGIEEIVTEAGGYEYQSGQSSIFSGTKTSKSIIAQAKERFGYGGQSPDNKSIVFINLREIRGIKFGTKGPQAYHDRFYDVDLEILAFGRFSLKITDPEKFVREFMPANVTDYTFDDPAARSQLLSEFIQSFAIALNSLSQQYRISELPAHSNEVVNKVLSGNTNASQWPERFGLTIISIGVENIEFSDESRQLVRGFSQNKMEINSYDNVSQQSANIAAQQKIAQGIEDNGLGDGAGMMFGVNLAQNMGTNAQVNQPTTSIDEQIELVGKLKALLDSGVLTQAEFDLKKKEIMGL